MNIVFLELVKTSEKTLTLRFNPQHFRDFLVWLAILCGTWAAVYIFRV